MGTPGKQLPQSGVPADEGALYFSYPDIEEADPSLAVDGYQLFFEREVPVELRSASTVDIPSEVGALEAIRAKILVKGQPSNLEAVKVELSSEANLFFHYTHTMDARLFAAVQESQRLLVDFNDYPTVLLRMLHSCVREPHLQIAVLVMQPNGEARLDFIQNMEYKFVELLSCRYVASSEEMVRAQVSYRYNVVKARMQLMQARLADINAMPIFLHVTSRVRDRLMQDHGLVMNGPDVHIVRKIGEGQDRPHGELPLDISLGKVVEFLVGRQKLPRDWHQRVSAIQARTADCYKQLPQALSKQLAGDAPLNYFKAVEVRNQLAATCTDRTFFGGLTGAAADWDKVVKAYEKNAVYLGEAALTLIQNADYELPYLRKQRSRTQHGPAAQQHQETGVGQAGQDAYTSYACQPNPDPGTA
ncbi:hypothetical protein QJQ45_020146 [Haematococcus lacustris]|nr:hypothetical protein QJQ45_020146 [Haematococcus lacustris]